MKISIDGEDVLIVILAIGTCCLVGATIIRFVIVMHEVYMGRAIPPVLLFR